MSFLIKQPNESRLYNFDFAALLESGETISSINSITQSPTGGITLGTPAISGTKAQVRISGGTNETYYKLTAIVTTSDGNTLEGEGTLRVKNI